MDAKKVYFISWKYRGDFGEHQYHVAVRKGPFHHITACGMNTIMHDSEPDFLKEKEPLKGGKWTICPVCKRQWKKKKKEFKFKKTERISPDS